MKKLIPGLLALVILLLFACKKDKKGSDLPTSDCSISCKVDGSFIEEESPGSCILLDNSLSIGLIGMDKVALQILDLQQAGTFDLEEVSNSVFVLLPDGTQIAALNGSIIVSQLENNNVKGTFSGTFYDIQDQTQTPAYTVTEGNFEMNF